MADNSESIKGIFLKGDSESNEVADRSANGIAGIFLPSETNDSSKGMTRMSMNTLTRTTQFSDESTRTRVVRESLDIPESTEE